MAQSSVVFSGAAGTGAQYQTLYLDFWLVSQDINNNRSKFGYQAKVASVVGGGGETYGGAYSFSGAYTTSASGLYWSWGSGGLVIASGEFTVAHSADGTLSKRTLTVSASYATYSGTASASTSVTLTIPTIPRATMPTAPSSHTLGNEMTISTPRASSAFTHTLKYSFHGASGTIATGVSTSAKWTPPETLANKIPNYTSGTCTITCETYQGTKLIGTKSTTTQLHLWSARVPTITAVEITEAVAEIAEKFTGGYLRYQSKLRVKTTASGIYGSTISKVVVAFDSKNYSGANIITAEPQMAAGTHTKGVVVTVTDSRGRKAVKEYPITILDYFTPKITAFTAVRVDEQGAPDDNGGRLKFTMKYAIAPVNEQNDHSWAFQRYDGIAWVDVNTGTGYTADQSLVTEDVFTSDTGHQVRLLIQDFFSSQQAVAQIPTGYALFNVNASGKGIAFGKVSEVDHFEMAMESEFYKNLSLHDSSIYTYAPNDSTGGWVRGYFLRRPDGERHSSFGLYGNAQTTHWSYIGAAYNSPYAIRLFEDSEPQIGSYKIWHNNIIEQQLATTGYMRLPSGLIIQWGNSTILANSSSGTSVSFPIAFPNALYSIVAQCSGHYDIHAQALGATKTGAKFYARSFRTGTFADYDTWANWIAIGR